MRPYLVLIALLVAAPVSAQERPRIDWPSYAVMVSGNVADLVTTRAAFKRGGIENNGFLSGQPMKTLIVSKASFVLGLAVLMRHLERTGHPRAAKLIGYIDGGVTWGVAARNTTIMRQ